MNDATTDRGTKKAAEVVQSSTGKGYTGTMENTVYIVTRGEMFDNEQVKSVHATLESAQKAATQLAEHEEIEEGLEFEVDTDGRRWKSGGHYIRIQAHTVL